MVPWKVLLFPYAHTIRMTQLPTSRSWGGLGRHTQLSLASCDSYARSRGRIHMGYKLSPSELWHVRGKQGECFFECTAHREVQGFTTLALSAPESRRAFWEQSLARGPYVGLACPHTFCCGPVSFATCCICTLGQTWRPPCCCLLGGPR